MVHRSTTSRRLSARRNLTFTATLMCLSGLATPIGMAQAAPQSRDAIRSTFVAPNDWHLRFEGRWSQTTRAATTVNSGSRMFLRFTGERVQGLFDTSTITNPPRIYVRIDGGPAADYFVDRPIIDFTPRALGSGPHLLELDVRDVDERANRWTPPLNSGVILTGLEIGRGGSLLPPPRLPSRTMEFLGDSITQGVRAVGPQIGPTGADATKDYAWLVGKAFHTDFAQVGFGAQGIVVPGGGGVPPAPAAFPYDFAGAPIDRSFVPDVVVVNQGTNDGSVASTTFEPAYLRYLREIRARWPHALIFAMRPFDGAHAGDIRRAVRRMRDRCVSFVDTTGWLRPDELTDGLHPTVTGHEVVARHLTRIIGARTGWNSRTVVAPTTALLAVGSTPGFEHTTRDNWRSGMHVWSVALTDTAPPEGAPAYDGKSSLAVTSAVAPMNEWRTVTLNTRGRLQLAASARDVFLYTSLAAQTTGLYDVRIAVQIGRVTYATTVYNIPNLAGFLPWDRIHVDIPGSRAARTVNRVTVSVRGEGTSEPGTLSFQIDDVGWTDRTDG